MGTYATTTGLEINMIGTAFDTATTSFASKMITNAEREVNKWLSKRYDVSSFTTFALTPPIVQTMTETLTEGYMYQRMARGGKEGLAHGKVLIDGVMANLKMLSEREADLLDSAGAPVPESANSTYKILSTTTDYSPTFNEDSELNWKADITKIDAIEDERE